MAWDVTLLGVGHRDCLVMTGDHGCGRVVAVQEVIPVASWEAAMISHRGQWGRHGCLQVGVVASNSSLLGFKDQAPPRRAGPPCWGLSPRHITGGARDSATGGAPSAEKGPS